MENPCRKVEKVQQVGRQLKKIDEADVKFVCAVRNLHETS